MARSARPTGGTWEVRFGTAELVRDLDRPAGWMLLVDGTPQSYVDLDDPEHLEFEYVRLMADLVDGLPPGPVTAVHLGGAGCTLARYVATTRPGSTQVVVEADDLLADVVRAQLGTAGFRLRVGDGREALRHLRPGTSDLVVADVFVGARVPGHLATVEHVREVRAVLRPGGVYVLNVADTGALPFARQQAAGLAEVFPHVVVLADPAVLRGRRFGNLVLAGSDDPFPLDDLRRVTARSIGRARVEDAGFARGARPATDADPPVAPLPPADVFDVR
ncbi:MAG: fused MFS/spermidine synthase [Mycobacteriales bacterium]